MSFKSLLLALLVGICVSLPIMAQTTESQQKDSTMTVIGQPKTVKYYAEIVYTDIAAPVQKSVKIDFGVNSVTGKRYPVFKDDAGKNVRFSTVVDALNFMSARGWVLELEYEDMYIDEGSSFGTVKHFIISKTMMVQNSKEL